MCIMCIMGFNYDVINVNNNYKLTLVDGIGFFSWGEVYGLHHWGGTTSVELGDAINLGILELPVKIC